MSLHHLHHFNPLALLYKRRRWPLFAINVGYWLVGLVMIGGVLAVWLYLSELAHARSTG